MNNKQILARYSELKAKGVASMQKNNQGEVVIVAKKFDPDTGEVIKTKTYHIDPEWVNKRKKEAKAELRGYKEIEADYVEASKLKFKATAKENVTN